MKLFGLSFLALVLMMSAAKAATLNTRLWVNGVESGTLEARQPAKIEFEYWDADTGNMAHHFHVMHAKPMHLIVVSEDLSHFAHVHPDLNPHTFKPFYLNANVVSSDPDNFAMPNLIPFAGHFYLFAESMPMDYGMLMFPYDLTATGLPRTQSEKPTPDQAGSDGKILKYFTGDGEATTEDKAEYLLKIEVLPMDHCQTIIPRLHIEMFSRVENQFQQIKDLDQWLESYGHAIMIGRDGVVAAEKAVLHLHAVWPLPTGDISKDERGPYLELTTHSHGKSMQSDQYRAWLQIQHHGKVRTFPFEILWDLEQARENAILSPAFCLQ
jgi:hypothetical protein